MKEKGILAYIMIGVITLIGLVNFFAQFIVAGYKPDPVITYILMGTASTIAGFKGITFSKRIDNSAGRDENGGQR